MHRGSFWKYEIQQDLEVESIDLVPGCADVLSQDPAFDLNDLLNAVLSRQGARENGDILATALKMSRLSCFDGADAYSLPDYDTTSSTLGSHFLILLSAMKDQWETIVSIANKYGLGKECRSSSSAIRNPYCFSHNESQSKCSKFKLSYFKIRHKRWVLRNLQSYRMLSWIQLQRKILMVGSG